MSLNKELKSDGLTIANDGLKASLDIESIKKNVETSPLNPGGANFKTHKLIENKSSNLSYKPTFITLVFFPLFVVIGLALLIGFFKMIILDGKDIFANNNWLLLAVGLVFTLVGSMFLYVMFKPRVFDKKTGLYLKGYKQDNNKSRNSKNRILLDTIVALQIIGEHVKGNDSSYPSYELNLVLNDSTRLNVIDHGNLKSVIADAEVISEFLNVPIWHATSNLK